MSDYTSCIIEFRKEYARELMPLIEKGIDCFCEGYITSKTIVAHFNGNRYDHSATWNDIFEKACELEEVHGGDVFHTMVYSTEYSIEECGDYCGCAYIGLCVDGHIPTYSLREFARMVREATE